MVKGVYPALRKLLAGHGYLTTTQITFKLSGSGLAPTRRDVSQAAHGVFSEIRQSNKRINVVLPLARSQSGQLRVIARTRGLAEKGVAELSQFLPRHTNGELHYPGQAGAIVAYILHKHFPEGVVSASKLVDKLRELDAKGKVPLFPGDPNRPSLQSRHPSRGYTHLVINGLKGLAAHGLVDLGMLAEGKSVAARHFTIAEIPKPTGARLIPKR